MMNNIHTQLGTSQSAKLRPQTAHNRNQTQLIDGDRQAATGTIFERNQLARPMSVNGRSGFKGNKIKSHNRLKSAAPGGRTMQDANSVADFVKASADPRGGIWA